MLYAIVGRPVWRDGFKGLPHLDGGSTSLFSSEVDVLACRGARASSGTGGATTAAERGASRPAGPP